MIDNANVHSWCCPQRLMDAAEILVSGVERDGRSIVLELSAESICETREAPLLHPQGQILALDIRRADVCRLSDCLHAWIRLLPNQVNNAAQLLWQYRPCSAFR